jgi:hypothetical protein
MDLLTTNLENQAEDYELQEQLRTEMNQELINDKLQELKNKAISKEERIYHYM